MEIAFLIQTSQNLTIAFSYPIIIPQMLERFRPAVVRVGLALGAVGVGSTMVDCSDGGSDATSNDSTSTGIEITEIPSQTAGLSEVPTVTIAPSPEITPSPVITEAPITPEPVDPLALINKTISTIQAMPAPEGQPAEVWEAGKFTFLEGIMEGQIGGRYGLNDIRIALETGNLDTADKMLNVDIFSPLGNIAFDEKNVITLSKEEIIALDPDNLLIPSSAAIWIVSPSGEEIANDLIKIKYFLQGN
jgi:hypothetical protein